MKSFIILSILALVLFLGTGQAQTMQHTEHSISVSGQGIIYGEPDLAVVEMGISTNDADAAKAVAEANDIIDKIRKIVGSLGVDDKDIRTSQFNIWPDQRYNNNGQPTSTTFRVNHSLSITVRDIETVGDVLAKSINAGANSVNNIRYTFADSKSLQKEARTNAMEAAKEKAQQLAGLADVNLGKVIRINESTSSGSNVPMPIAMPEMAYNTAASMDMSVPASGGQLAVQVNLFVVYSIEVE